MALIRSDCKSFDFSWLVGRGLAKNLRESQVSQIRAEVIVHSLSTRKLNFFWFSPSLRIFGA